MPVVILVAALLLAACEKKETSPQPPAAPAASQPAPVATPNPAFAKLKGKWMRSDGDYIIEIKNVDASGKLDAAYFNPNPIHVAKAQATQEGGQAKVFIELRDVNYPGSTYTLVHDPASDQLKGVYFQAVTRESYDIAFQKLESSPSDPAKSGN